MSSFTSGSGVFFNDDGSCGVGVECFFDQAAPQATQTWTFTTPINAVELWGNVSMRTSGKEADVLVGLFLDNRLVWGAILKAANGTVNLPAHQAPIKLTVPATIVRVEMGAAGSGDAWSPMNCEIRLIGRWE